MNPNPLRLWLQQIALILVPFSALAFPDIRPWWDVSGSTGFEQKIDVNGDGIPDLALISKDTWSGNPQRYSVDHQYQFSLRTLGDTRVLFANPPGTSAKLFKKGDVFAIDSAFDEVWQSGQLSLGTISSYSTLSPTGPGEVETDSSPWKDSDGCLGVKVSGINGTQAGWVFFLRHLVDLCNPWSASRITSGAAAPGEIAIAQVSRHEMLSAFVQDLDLDQDGVADVSIQRRWSGATNIPPAAVFLRSKSHCELLTTITDPPNWNWVSGPPLFEVLPPEIGWATAVPYRQRIPHNDGFTHHWSPGGSLLFARLLDPNGVASGPAAGGSNVYLAFKLVRSPSTVTTLGWLELTPNGTALRFAAALGGLTFAGDTVPLESSQGVRNQTTALYDFNNDGLVDLQGIYLGNPYPAPWQPDTLWMGDMWRLMEPGMTTSTGGWGGLKSPALLKGTLIRPCGIPHPEFGEQPNAAGQDMFAEGYLPLWMKFPDGCHVGWVGGGAFFIHPEPNRGVMAGYQDDDTEQPRLRIALAGDKVNFSWPSHLIGFELQGMLLSQAKPTWYRIEGTSAGIGMSFQSNRVTAPRTSATLNGQWIFRAYRPKIVPR